MASWRDVETSAPEFAEAVRALFDAYRHKTLATLRKDGSPRISGIEAEFVEGDLRLGAMWHSVKALDLRRDPRFALHSGTGDADPATWKGDAKIAGRAEEITDPAHIAAVQAGDAGEAPPGPSHLFRADITEVVLTRVGDPPDHLVLVIEVWREGQGLQRLERR
ncbi:MAG: pyridoxamine 5'-phosphate oxidase family protein [Chloroflexota bacterium]|nr:pyridoxamine 5'-phosphate oxidase family protein [Chloroflexota bacterium]